VLLWHHYDQFYISLVFVIVHGERKVSMHLSKTGAVLCWL